MAQARAVMMLLAQSPAPFDSVPQMPKESDPDIRIARIIAGLLNLQVSRIRRRWPDFGTTDFDDFSLGYMFGFVDVMTQRVGIVDEDDAWRIFASLAKALFGRDMGEAVCVRLPERQNWPEAVWGASTGRNDSLSWLKDPTIPPLGWYQYCRSESSEAFNSL